VGGCESTSYWNEKAINVARKASWKRLEGRIRWRQEAPFHVQLELMKDSPDFRVPSDVRVQGRVLHVFRSDGRLMPGDHIVFRL
jgi:hypothetical protein